MDRDRENEPRVEAKDLGGQASEFDARAYLRVIKKRWGLIVLTIAVVVGAAAAWTMQKPKIYEAMATVIIDPQAPKVLPTQDVVELGAGNFWDSHEYYNTQARILRSRWLAQEVVRRYPNLLANKAVAGRVAGREQDAAESYIQGGMVVAPVRESRIFGIGFRDTDPQLAAELANDVVAVYIEQNRAVKLAATNEATRWVAKQLDEARSELSRSETALYDFKKENNILSVNQEERQNLISKALDGFSTALNDTKRKRIDLQARRRAVMALMSGDDTNVPSSYVAESQTIGPLRAAYLDERRKLRALTDRYGEKWPEVEAQQVRLKSSLDDLRAEGQRLLRSIDAEINALLESEGRYGAEVARLTAEAFALNQKEIEYKRLTRDAVNTEQVYSLLLKRLNESGLQAQDQTNNIRPLDTAEVPTVPSEPRLRQAVAFAFLGGLVLALLLAFFLEQIDRSVKSQEDVEQGLGLPFLGLIPSVKQAADTPIRELFIVKHPKSSVAESCRVVRTNILFCSPDRPLRTMLVTSPNPLEGKTMMTVNLGVAMAQNGSRTLLVDTDMSRPRLHRILQASVEHGVSRVIVGEGSLEDAIKSTDVPNLFILPCGPLPPNPAELLQTERFLSLVKRLGEKFDRVLFDSPPVMAVTDATILSRIMDGTIIVARASRTGRDSLARTAGQIKAVGSNLVGIVLNDVDLSAPGYHRYYAYKYQYYSIPDTEKKGAEG
jgi:capsular exopolysaccharide synthesis family protein